MAARTQSRDDRGPDLMDVFGVLARRKWTIVMFTAVLLGAALAASFLQTPVYNGEAQLLIETRGTSSVFGDSSSQAPDPVRVVQTEIQVIKSKPLRKEVAKKFNPPGHVAAAPVGQTDVVTVRVSSTDPGRAAALANAYAQAYIDYRRNQRVNDLVDEGKLLQNKVTELNTQIAALDTQVSNASAANRAAVDDNVRPQRDALIQQVSLFKQKLDQLQVDQQLNSGGAHLVAAADPPESPSSPRPLRTGALALLIGLGLGTIAAFVFEYLDDSIKTKEDAEKAARDLPVIGLVPLVPGWRDRAAPMIVSIHDPSSAAAEAYRTLRTSTQFMSLDRPMRTLQITSPIASEGKTTTLANLAVALARAGQRVIVVCCDLRRPRIHEFFGVDNAVGFTSVLLGEVPLPEALQRVPGETRVMVMASGPPPPNPSELLSSRRTVEVLTALQNEADIVLVDCPPVLPVTDAAVLSNRVDATLMVATAGSTTRRDLERAVEVLRQVDAPLIGMVLNGIGPDSGYGYGYGYGSYGSGATTERPSNGTRAKSGGGRPRARARGAAR